MKQYKLEMRVMGDADEYEQLQSTKFDTGKNPPTIYIGE
jgi:hypothetical protein